MPNVSGIFSLPVAGDHVPVLPGLRFLQSIPLGPAFGRSWRLAQSSATLDSDVQPLLASSDSATETDASISETYKRILAVIEDMRSDSSWHGTSYSLLSRNCNSFTDELAFRLTGIRAPSWISTLAL